MDEQIPSIDLEKEPILPISQEIPVATPTPDIKVENKAKARDINIHINHRRNGASIILGLIVLLAGIVLLLNSIGLVTWTFWNIAFKFWPVLLILLGFQIILGRNWFSRLVILIFAILFLVVIIIYGLVQAGSPLANHLPGEIINLVNNF